MRLTTGLAAAAATCVLLGSPLAPQSFAIPLSCSAAPSGGPPVIVELEDPSPNGVYLGCEARVTGRVLLEQRRGHDVYIVLDSSGSTAGASGIDVDGDGFVGTGDWRAPTDPDDSTLRGELEAVRRALDVWTGHDVRVSLEEYSAVIPIPPGEPNEQGRIRTVQGLTYDMDAVRRGLGTIALSSSVGATDYGGALMELSAELDRSRDPSRNPIGFFLSDGKPTFPRFPYDQTEPPDVDWALEGARSVAARSLPVHTIEIGTFDDIGVLQQVSDITGGTVLPRVTTGAQLVDSLSSVNLDGFTQVVLTNSSSGQTGTADLDAFGSFTATIPLQEGLNELTLVAVLRTPQGEYTLSCPVSLVASCGTITIGDDGLSPVDGGGIGGDTNDRRERPPDTEWRREPRVDYGGGGLVPGGAGGGGGGGGGGGFSGGYEGDDGWRGRRPGTGRNPLPGTRFRHPETAQRLWRWHTYPCIVLEGGGPFGTACDELLRQLAALSLSLEDELLRLDCRLRTSMTGGRSTVGTLLRDMEDALDDGNATECAQLAAIAARVNSGEALDVPAQGPPPSGGPYTFDCTTLQDGADVNVTVNLTSPAPGSAHGAGRDCNARVTVRGGASASGTSNHDVYFVVDTSGSTAGDSGRDVNGDGSNDTTLDAELEALRAFVQQLDPARARVALVEFSAVIPIPPGEPNEQGRIRTVVPLTPDFAQFFAGLDTIRAAGSVGATDYGGALQELAAEYDRHGDPARGNVAFFLSDGKPTFPRYPYDSSETPDVDWAMDGATACASRGIKVNTYEVGVFDDLSVLNAVAQTTGGRFFPSLAGGAIVDALPGSSLVGIQSVTVTNDLTGETRDANVAPDGSFTVDIRLARGENGITITTVSDNGAEIVECHTILIGECNAPDCQARTAEEWRETECP